MNQKKYAIESAVARLASAQHGLVSVAQLDALGLSRAAIGRRIGNGRWNRAAERVVRIGGAPVTWESEVLAQILSAGNGAVASHRTAAALWDLDGFRPGGRPELSVPRGRWYRTPASRTHESSDLEIVRPVVRHGIPTTPIDRTLLDLGAVTNIRRVQLAVDDARRRSLTDWDRLLTCLVLHARKGRNGVGTLRRIVDEHIIEVATTESGFERLVYACLVEAGLPRPTLQHEVRILGCTYRIDLAYPDAKVAIELDGSVHLRRDVWERDHARQNALVLGGWKVVRFTWNDYRHRPARVVADVRAALELA